MTAGQPKSSTTVIILAAGRGTRMRSVLPKVLHRTGGRTVIDHVLRLAASMTSYANMVVVLGHQAESVRVALAGHPEVKVAIQDGALGTGHAVCAARTIAPLNALCLVLYGDSPLLRPATLDALLAHQTASGAAATLITAMLDYPGSYGRIATDSAGDVAAIIEPNMATPAELGIKEINSGVYCFRSDLLWRYIERIRPDNPLGEYYLTDIVSVLRADGFKVAKMQVSDPDEILGVNTQQDLATVDGIFRRRIINHLHASGVTILQPHTVLVDPDVTVGAGTSIGPFSQLLGASIVGRGCVLDGNCVIVDSRLGDDVRLGAFSVIRSAVLTNGAVVPPFSLVGIGSSGDIRMDNSRTID